MESSTGSEVAGIGTLKLPSPYVDPELVEQLTGVTGEQAFKDTLELNTYIRDGSLALYDYAVTSKQEAKAKPARTAFYAKLGWTGASHGMYTWYHDTLDNWPYGIQPGVVIQNIKFVRSLYGAEHLPDNVHKARTVLGVGPQALLDAYGYRVRLASVFGRNEEYIARILRERPRLLQLSRKTIYFYARVAADHGKPIDPGANVGEVVRALQINGQGRTHGLMSGVAGISTGAKRIRASKDDEAPSRFLLALNSLNRQRKVGNRVTQAYFRHSPVHNRKLLQTPLRLAAIQVCMCRCCLRKRKRFSRRKIKLAFGQQINSLLGGSVYPVRRSTLSVVQHYL